MHNLSRGSARIAELPDQSRIVFASARIDRVLVVAQLRESISNPHRHYVAPSQPRRQRGADPAAIEEDQPAWLSHAILGAGGQLRSSPNRPVEPIHRVR